MIAGLFTSLAIRDAPSHLGRDTVVKERGRYSIDLAGDAVF